MGRVEKGLGHLQAIKDNMKVGVGSYEHSFDLTNSIRVDIYYCALEHITSLNAWYNKIYYTLVIDNKIVFTRKVLLFTTLDKNFNLSEATKQVAKDIKDLYISNSRNTYDIPYEVKRLLKINEVDIKKNLNQVICNKESQFKTLSKAELCL